MQQIRNMVIGSTARVLVGINSRQVQILKGVTGEPLYVRTGTNNDYLVGRLVQG